MLPGGARSPGEAQSRDIAMFTGDMTGIVRLMLELYSCVHCTMSVTIEEILVELTTESCWIILNFL